MEFTEKHADKLLGVLHWFDRMIFREYLTSFFQTTGMYYYLSKSGVLLKEFKIFVLKKTEELKIHIENISKQHQVQL